MESKPKETEGELGLMEGIVTNISLIDEHYEATYRDVKNIVYHENGGVVAFDIGRKHIELVGLRCVISSSPKE